MLFQIINHKSHHGTKKRKEICLGSAPQSDHRRSQRHCRCARHKRLLVMTAGCFYQNYREVRLLIIHCSATRYDRDFPVEALRASHKARGFADIGYHFYITRDGYLHRCRPSTRSAHMQPGGTTGASASVMKAASMRREPLPTPVPTPRNVRCSTCSASSGGTIRRRR